MLTTRIQFETDHAICAILAPLSHDDAIIAACDVLKNGKHPGDYAHLDNGRRKMTAGNMLRAAARKDASIVNKLRAAVADCEPAVKPKRSRAKAAAPKVSAPASIEWPKSKRFQFAALKDGAWTFSYTRKDLTDVQRPE